MIHRSLGAVPLRRYLLDAVLCLVVVTVGGAQAWHRRYEFSTGDIISYLDVADLWRHGEWGSVINGIWSPLYSWLLALAQLVLHLPPELDACRVKVVNFLVFLAALAGFRWFLQQMIEFHEHRSSPENPGGTNAFPRWVLLCAGYALFFLASIRWTGVDCDTPDLSTAVLVYLACGLLLRLGTKPARWFHHAALGAILGLAYLSKAALLPLAAVFLLAGTLARVDFRAILVRALPALLALVVVAGPYVAALSLMKGRITFSETGKLSYIWYVNPGGDIINDLHWQGGPAAWGAPLHPTRQLLSDPDVFEFAQPLGGPTRRGPTRATGTTASASCSISANSRLSSPRTSCSAGRTFSRAWSWVTGCSWSPAPGRGNHCAPWLPPGELSCRSWPA